MIPLRDSIPSRTTPYINYAIIAICSAAFLIQYTSEDRGSRIIEQYGMVPARLANPDVQPEIVQEIPVQTSRGVERRTVRHKLAPVAVPPWLTLITCMFLHGGIMHFLGNMWFLYVFGDNVEDRLGHIGYLLMYVGTGIAASMAHYVQSGSDNPIPTIGASGAIAGVMGAYAWLYPKSRVQAVLPIPILLRAFVVPAPLFLAVWFGMQMFNGMKASAGASGVAWWAHIGGFAAGAVVALMIGRSPIGREPVAERRF